MDRNWASFWRVCVECGLRRQGGQWREWFDALSDWSLKSISELIRLAEIRSACQQFVYGIAHARETGTAPWLRDVSSHPQPHTTAALAVPTWSRRPTRLDSSPARFYRRRRWRLPSGWRAVHAAARLARSPARRGREGDSRALPTDRAVDSTGRADWTRHGGGGGWQRQRQREPYRQAEASCRLARAYRIAAVDASRGA